MNYVRKEDPKNGYYRKYNILDLVSKYNSETAFVGRCDCYRCDSLYLIGYKCVFSAENPKERFWGIDHPNGIDFYVKEFVDIDIIIKDREF
jgi:hypothetical protein